MNKWLLALIFTAIAVAPLGAVTISSCNSMTLDSLISLTTTGCRAQDVIFSNFSYSHTGFVAGSEVQAGQITANLISANAVTGDSTGWIFSPTQGWTSGTFVLSYTAQVVNLRPFVIAQLFAANNPPNANISVTEELNGAASPANLHVWWTSYTDKQLDVSAAYDSPGFWQFDVVNTGNASTGTIARFDNYFYQTPADVPEPAAQLLTGSALLALSLCLKRFKRS